MQKQKHIPVLLEEILHYLAPKEGDSYLDLTAGYGGHADAILKVTNQPEKTVLVDRDEQAVSALNDRLAATGVKIVHQDFLTASRDQLDEGSQFDMILADLGVSSPQLEQANRGFSFRNSGPLDMRLDSRQQLSAKQIVNQTSESELIQILTEYGEEPKARQIARNIITERPIKDTDQLAKIASRAWPGHSRVHPATRTFQAVRIAVNDELNQLKEALPIWLELLNEGGRMVVITFHSLEDRIVKQFLNDNSADQLEGDLQILTKKPVQASKNEIVFNPRARSAKLRAAVKIKTHRKDQRKTRDAY